MKPLPHQDSIHLQAAIGWLELDNHLEANEELEKIQPILRAHPLVLRVRWDVYAKAKRWDGALEISRTLTEMLPEDVTAWRLHANTLYLAEQTQAAYDLAKTKLEQFATDWCLPYNLACYACQLGKMDEAKSWLHKAMELGNADEVRLNALDDPDLGPLRKVSGLV